MNRLKSRRRLLLGAMSLGAGLYLVRGGSPAWAAEDSAQPAALHPLAKRLAGYVDGLTYKDIDAQTLEAVKLRLLDTIGCALAAVDEPVVAKCFRIAASANGGRSTLFGTRRRTTPELAAFANGAAIRYYDLNDGYASNEIGHPSDFVSVCLAVAQSEGRSVRDFIVSVVAAYEIECRLFDAASISARGWDNPTYGVVTAALAAGKLMRLPIDQLTQAVNIALVNHVAMNQTRVQELSNWKGLADASAAQHGVFAATLAQQGISGPSPIFEGTLGFNRMVAGGDLMIDTATFGGKGNAFRINDVLVKPYPAQGHTLTAVEAAVNLSRKINDPRQIESVTVATTQIGLKVAATGPQVWAPATKETADHSMPYIVARTLLDGTLTNDSYAPQRLTTPDVRALMAKMKIAEDPALTALYPHQIPNRLSVMLRSGEILTEQINDLPGSPSRPLTREFVEAKFWRTLGQKVSRRQGDRLVRRVRSLEQMGRVDELFELYPMGRSAT